MKKKVILLAGPARSGKDTIAKMIQKETSKSEILSFAGPLKQIIASTFDISLEDLDFYKNKSDKFILNLSEEEKSNFNVNWGTNFRQILQRFGTEGMKPVFGDGVWADIACKKIKESNNEVFIIPDFRFQIEANTVLELVNNDIANVYFLNIYSDMCTITDNQHISEKDLENFEFDETINNMQGKLQETEFVVSEFIKHI